MPIRWSLVDRSTRVFWRTVGRPIDLTGDQAWLDAPMSDASVVGDSWLAASAKASGAVIRDDVPGAGLLASMDELDGPGFRAADLAASVRAFYEHTSDWRVEVWTQWSTAFQPGGEAISRLFGRRVHQLAIPTRPLDVARGMDSRVTLLCDPDGRQLAAGWVRRLRSTGETVYSGRYATRTLPGHDRPSVHVTFPLEAGNVQVFLRPHIEPGGALVLESPGGPFGEDGAYVVVREPDGRAYTSRAPIHETFRVYVDEDDVLRTDHELRFAGRTAVRLHYKLERKP